MANHGAKFQSVNLNKSYGQQHQPSHHTFQRFGGGGGFYGQATAAGRSRGGGGGMVVLSRNRSTPAKVAPKLSVPPPLNLPSLRKEHEKFDMLGPGGSGSGAGAASGSRPTSSGAGWTKTVATGFPEKNEIAVGASAVDGKDVTDGASRAVGSYMPPSARPHVVGPASASQVSPPYAADTTMVLRGEDFPSLQAARPVSSDSLQKQKDGLIQKQKHGIGEESAQDNRGSYHLDPLVDVQQHPSLRVADGNGIGEYGGKDQGSGGGQMAYRLQKEEDLRDPLPLVNVIPRSDWADDERDTGHGLVERGRHVGLSNHESYWDRDYDLPRPSVLPRKPVQNQFGRWVQRDNETGKKYSSEVLKTDPYNKDARATNDGKEDDKWRTSTSAKDRFGSQEVGYQRGDVGSMMAGNIDMVKENKYTSPHSGDIGQNDSITTNRDSAVGKRDSRLVEPQQRNLSTELYNNRGLKQRNGNTQQPTMYRGDDFQNNSVSRSSASFRRRLPPVTDPILTMDRRFSRNDTSYSEDPFLRDFDSAGFDDRDLFSGGLVGVIKRKKDASRSTEFHDPVRESFEAELERVQKMQELERQRIVEEQERALEQARREEEERQRRIREEEELQQRLEKEAQEAAGRAEQERLEAIRRAEEQRIAREEERRRIQEEEERRKQAAKQKLLELEAKMAKREAQVAKDDVSLSKTFLSEKLDAIQENHIPRNMDLDNWEDGKRTVENVTMSGAYDSSAHGRLVEMNLEPYPFPESSANFTDRGKGNNTWRRDAFVNGGSFSSPLMGPVIGPYSPRRETFDGGRAALQKEFRGGAMPSGAYLDTRIREPYSKEFGYERDNRWNLSGNISSFGKQREMDSEFPDGIADMYSDNGWGQGSSHGNSRPPYSESLYPHSGDSDFHSYGRSRFSMRQPRVLPPPIGSAKRTNFSGVSEHEDPSTFVDTHHYATAARAESHGQRDYYGSNQRGFEPSEVFELQQDNTASEEQKLNDSSRCYSQSSLSVSSPPVSPPQLSHDELDEFGDSPVPSSVAEGKVSFRTGIVNAVHNGETGNSTSIIASASVSAVEDEEWTIENDDKLLRQEEYYEDVDGSREEGDECEIGEENLELNEKFGGLELEERVLSQVGENVVIGFDQGIQVVIPSDDFEDNSRAQERSCGIPASAMGIMEGTRAVDDGFNSDEQFASPAEDSLDTSGDRCLGKVPETVGLQDSIFPPVGAPCSSATENLLDGADTSASTGLAAQGSVPSSNDDATAAVSQKEMGSLSSAGQGDLPVNLQFGLFSGPSLIPSPVPTIQIGSIQMPLHIHPFGTSVAHMPSSQPSVFQFGQLHYATPISQGILSMAPHSMPFVQPNIMGDFNPNQNARCALTHRPAPDTFSQIVTKDEVPPLSLNKSPSFLSVLPDQSNGRPPQVLNSVLDGLSPVKNTVQSSSEVSEKQMNSESASQAEEKGRDHTVTGYISSKTRESEMQSHHVRSTMHSFASEKNSSVHRSAGSFSGGRGRRVAYAVKNTSTRSFFQDHDVAGIQRKPRRTVQRTEFRVRQNTDRRSSIVLVSSSAGLDDKLNYEGKSGGVFSRSGSKRGTTSARSTKQRLESESSASGNPGSQNASSGDRGKELVKNLSTKSWNTFHTDEANFRNSSGEVVDAPLQSGVVHVFKQPGIEAPSDEDDFIEVRSKRQMLNDRREQKEKEIKEKSRATKPPRKPHATRQKDVVSRRNKNFHVPASIEKSNHSQLDFTASEGAHSASNEVSTGFGSTVSLPKTGTPVLNSEPKAIKPHQVDSMAPISNVKTDCDPGLALDNMHQTQFDKAMQLAGYDLSCSAVGDHSSTFTDPILSASSILSKDNSYSSGASPANSLLAEDQIQYGSKKSDLQLAHSFSVSEKDNPLYPGKEKLQTDSCVPLQDCEAEAEAAASAVAVAAISSDGVVRKGLGSVNNTKSFSSADIDGIATGVAGDQHLAGQLCSDELLTVSLPADLSVETTPISLWPPVQSPQSSSSQMISHFAGGPPSPFPFYEMNPVLGGPIFASSPHEDSLGSSQPQKSAALNSRPLGNWQQFQSGVDSFYCPPTGYSAPFIGAPSGIPGVQGPPHMVLYNHFAPVGQYGHVGLSFMGTTFIPTGKQADWKNTSTSSSTSVGDGDINNAKIINGQRHAPNISAPVQHLAPGSPLLPIPSPLPMFDVSSFQIASDAPVPTHWGHIPASPLHPAPVSQPLQPQGEGAVPSQVNREHSTDHSLSANMFSKSRTPTSENGSSPTMAVEKNVAPFPAELGPVGPLVSSMASSVPSVTVQGSSGIAETEPGMINKVDTGKNQSASRLPVSAQQGNASTGNYQRGGTSQRTNTRNEWTHRRMGFHGRDHSTKGFRGTKMKQIYVAKQPSTNSSTT